MIDGLFFGILLAIGLCNLYVAFAVRDRSAAWFVGYVGALIANELIRTGLGSGYLWPGIGFDARWPSVVTELLALGAFLGFTRSFLQTRAAAPKWDRLLILAFVAVAVSEIARRAFPGGERFAALVLLVNFAAMMVTAGAGVVRVRARAILRCSPRAGAGGHRGQPRVQPERYRVRRDGAMRHSLL